MRIPGYCTGCRRIKQVQVSGSGMTAVALGRTASGVCAQCQDTCRTCNKSERECRADAHKGTQPRAHHFMAKG